MDLPGVLRCYLQFTLKSVWIFEEGKKCPRIAKGIPGAAVSLQGARLCHRRAWLLLMGFWSQSVLHKSLKQHGWVSCSSASLRGSGFPAGCLVGGVWKDAPEAALLDAEYAPFIVHRYNQEKDISEWSNKCCWGENFQGASWVWRTGSCCLSRKSVLLVCTQKKCTGHVFLPERRNDTTVNRSIQKLGVHNMNT